MNFDLKNSVRLNINCILLLMIIIFVSKSLNGYRHLTRVQKVAAQKCLELETVSTQKLA